MKIQNMFTVEKPREKLIRYGVKRLKLFELIATIIGTGTGGRDVIVLAKEIEKQITSHENIQTIPWNKIKGVGKAKQCALLASIELGERIYMKGTVQQSILQPRDVWNDLYEVRKGKKEQFIAYYLDSHQSIIKREVVSMGTVNSSIVHPREVFEPALRYTATAVLVAHNHPSGDLRPSEDDRKITKKLIDAGEILGIELIDHVIVTPQSFMSMRAKADVFV